MPKAIGWSPEQQHALDLAIKESRACDRAEAKLDLARERRNAAFGAAVDAGISPYFTARACGKSHALVYHAIEVRVCSVPDCGKAVSAGGLCGAHYTARRRAGMVKV